MGQAAADVIGGIDLTGDRYTVKQHLLRNKYQVLDANGELVLQAKQKLFKMREEFPFVDANDEPIFRIKAQGVLDVAGDYTLIDEASGDPIAVLGKQFTLFKHIWKVKAPDDERVLATIESRSAVVEALRSLSSIFSLLPHKYSIEGPNGESYGEIQGQFSVRDTYEIDIGDTGDTPREAIVAAAIAIDALEGN